VGKTVAAILELLFMANMLEKKKPGLMQEFSI
jgi:hypothetical protein